MFLGIIFINTIHNRSYYFARNGMVTAFDTLRQINLLSPFFSIITSFGVYKIYLLVKSKMVKNTKAKILSYSLIFLMSFFFLFQSYSTRNNLIEIERSNRIFPITELQNILDKNKDIVITDESVLLHNYSQASLMIIDFTVLSNYFKEKNINSLLNDHNIYLIWKDYFSEEIFRKRYEFSFKLLEKYDMLTIKKGEHFQIIKLEKNNYSNKKN